MSDKETLLVQLEQAFRSKSWHGTNLLGSVRRLKPEVAAWRPGEGRHNIWEIIVHAAYWKYSVLRRLTGGKRGGFAYDGSDWFPRPVDNADLAEDLRLVKEYHAELVRAVEEFSPKMLAEVPNGSKTAYRDLIIGAAAHDLYHAGQIQLIKRLNGGS